MGDTQRTFEALGMNPHVTGRRITALLHSYLPIDEFTCSPEQADRIRQLALACWREGVTDAVHRIQELNRGEKA